VLVLDVLLVHLFVRLVMGKGIVRSVFQVTLLTLRVVCATNARMTTDVFLANSTPKRV
jgi:hypothetical protein